LELSRDVERAPLTCPVWMLEGVGLDYLFPDIFLNISKTVLVSSVKFLPFIKYNILPYNAPVDFEK